MFLNIGKLRVPAGAIDAELGLALKLLAAFSNPDDTKRALEELLSLRDKAIDYAGKEQILHQANDLKKQAEYSLAQATEQASILKANAEAEVAALRAEARKLKQVVDEHKESVAESEAWVEHITQQAKADVAKLQEQASKELESAKNVSANAQAEFEKGRALRLEFETKLQKLKNMLETSK